MNVSIKLSAVALFFASSAVISSKAQTINSIDTFAWTLAVDGGGNVYTAPQTCKIYKRTPSGVVTMIGGIGLNGFSGDGGLAISAKVHCDQLATAGGNIYFIDATTRVRKIDALGTITTIAGADSAGFTGDGGPAIAAKIVASAIAADGAGNVYIAGYGRIRKINTTGIISTIAGTGVPGHTGDGGAATAAQIDGDIRSIALDPFGNIYFTCVGYNRVRKVSASGIIKTVAGTGAMTPTYNGDGIAATTANIGMPYGLATDGAGNIYISDFQNNRIRKVNSAGIISTIAGTTTHSCPIDGSAATGNPIWTPEEMGIDGSGNLYFESGGCEHMYKISNVASTAEIGEIETNSVLRVSPTVTSRSFTISGTGTKGMYQLIISNLQGQVVLSEDHILDGQTDIPVSLPNNISDGVYVVTLRSESVTMVTKCVLMK